jgi:WD40 repeat protein
MEDGDGVLRIFEPQTGRELAHVRLPVADYGVLRFTPDGRRLPCSNINGFIAVLDTRSWKAIRVFRAHQGKVKDMEVSPDGKVIASVGDDGFVKTWDLGSGAALQAFSPGEGQAQDVEFLDDRHLAVRGESGPVLVYTLDVNELLDIARHCLTRGFTRTECQTYHIDPCPDLAAVQQRAG